MIQRNGNSVTKSREIIRTDIVVPASKHYNLAGTVVESTPSAGGPLTVRHSTESIAYSTKPAKQRHKSNFCNHQKYMRNYSGNGLSPNWTVSLTPGHVNHPIEYYQGHLHGELAHGTALSTAYGPSQLNVSLPLGYWGDAQGDMNDIFAQLRPDLTAISLPNFFLELDDVGKLFQAWKKNLSLSKNVAGAHLNYSFGWAPLLGDIREMTDIISGLIGKLKAFEDAANQVIETDRIISNDVIAKSGTFNYAGNSHHPCTWSGTLDRVKKAGLTYRMMPFRVTHDYQLMLRAYLDALGFELNPRISWDALPFTFVLDWFFGIGSWLERHKYDTLEIPIVYVDSYVSCKQTVSVQSTLILNQNDPGVTAATSWPTWMTSRISFVRIPIAPLESAFSAEGWRMPSVNQALLGVSLATVLKR
jgi:hypothetical protein